MRATPFRVLAVAVVLFGATWSCGRDPYGCYDSGPGCGTGSASCSSRCKAYVTCFEATGGIKGELDSTYGAMGTCWSTTTAAASACTRACVDGLQALQAAHPDAGC